jgi:rod shape-determining protein MreD
MIKLAKILFFVGVALFLQVTLFPRLFADPFQPDFLILVVVNLGLAWPFAAGAPLSFALGLLQDCFSGSCFGLNGFSYLLVFFVLNRVADRLYTDNIVLNVLAVFVATILQGVTQLFLLLLFPAAPGTYLSLLPSLIPHAAVNAGLSFALLKLVSRLRITREAA